MAMRTLMTAYRAPDGRRRRPRQTLGREWVTLEVLTSRATIVMAAKRWSGWFVWEWLVERGRVCPWPDDWSYSEVCEMKRKVKPTDDAVATAQASMESRVFAAFPHLREHMAVRQYDDKTSRQTGSVMMNVIGSMWRVIVKDHDTQMQVVVIMPTLDDALTQAELLLGVDECPWEPDPFARPKASPRAKK